MVGTIDTTVRPGNRRVAHSPSKRYVLSLTALCLPAIYLLVVVVRVRLGQANNDAVQYPAFAAILFLVPALGFTAALTVLARWRWLIAAAAVAGLTVMSLAATAWAVHAPLHRAHRVPVPAATASAQTVLATEIEAMNAHDMATVCALTEPGSHAADGCGKDQTISVRVLHMGSPTAVDQQVAPGIDPTTVDIGVSLDWRLRSPDTGVDDGVDVQFFDLARTGPQKAWRITGVGTGP